MICYVCSRNATHRVYADLKPVCDTHMVETVNEEQGDLQVVSINAVVDAIVTSTHNQQIDAIMDNMRKLVDMQKGKLKYALSDLSDWLEYDLEKVCVMLDELRTDGE